MFFSRHRKMRNVAGVAGVACLVAFMQPVLAASSTETRGASVDTFVSMGRPTQSFGTMTSMEVNGFFTKQAQIMLMDFGTVSSASSVTSASVRLHSFYKSTDFAYAFAINESFNNSTTFNSSKINFNNAVYQSKFVVPTEGNKVTFDVTNAARAGRVRLAIVAGGTVRSTFASSENGDSTKRPVLSITRGGTVTPTTKPTTPTTKPTTPTTKPPATTSTTKKTSPTVTTVKPGGGDTNVTPSGSFKMLDTFSSSGLNSSSMINGQKAKLWIANWLGSEGSTTNPINSSEEGCYKPSLTTQPGDGFLHLKLASNSDSNCHVRSGSVAKYAGGMVQSNNFFTFKTGYIEFRAKVPGSGSTIYNWPGLWTDGQGNWPTTGEIDVMEGLSGRSAWHVHTNSGGPGGGSNTGAGWHTYAAQVDNGKVTFFYDGVNQGSSSFNTSPANAPQFVIMNHGVSGSIGGPTVNNTEMLIDYVFVR